MADFNYVHLSGNLYTVLEVRIKDVIFNTRELSKHVLEPTKGKNVLDVALTSQKKCVAKICVNVCEPLCCDHSILSSK